MTADRPRIMRTPQEWKAVLTAEQYRITREHGTERAYSGPWWNEHRLGTYVCVCCGSDLFDATTKFESGTGWPSFFAPVAPDAVSEHEDRSWFMRRTEIRCATCEAHLGHVFPDGPEPTGLRYCMNGHAMRLRLEDGSMA